MELQRKLLDSAPRERDLRSIVRINAEEMSHSWQMSYLLVRYFGADGKAEARKLLERRAALADSFTRAAEFSEQARRNLERFPPVPARQAMLDLADFCVERAY